MGFAEVLFLKIESVMRWAIKQTRVDSNSQTGTGRDVGKTGGYSVFDLNATLTKIKPLTLKFGISNLLDKTYANHLNRANVYDTTKIQVNEAGRSYYMQAKFEF